MIVSAGSVLWPRTLATPTIDEFQKQIPGQAVTEISRRGKYLVIRLSRDTLLIHLRMSGDLMVFPNETLPALHDRLIVSFQGGYRLVFNDPRKFGRVWLVADPDDVLAPLGPEPLDEDLTPERFYSMLQHHRRQLKPLLLDQSFIAGLGNIYTDEALHMAGLHPLQLSQHISVEQAGRLLASIRHVLQEGIRRNGASIDWVYRGGDFQNYFRVYQRTGQPCPVCDTPVERSVIGQRSSHYCPKCQPPPV
jgi:formamidopyrimidine-DNA glycosylase